MHLKWLKLCYVYFNTIKKTKDCDQKRYPSRLSWEKKNQIRKVFNKDSLMWNYLNQQWVTTVKNKAVWKVLVKEITCGKKKTTSGCVI